MFVIFVLLAAAAVILMSCVDVRRTEFDGPTAATNNDRSVHGLLRRRSPLYLIGIIGFAAVRRYFKREYLVCWPVTHAADVRTPMAQMPLALALPFPAMARGRRSPRLNDARMAVAPVAVAPVAVAPEVDAVAADAFEMQPMNGAAGSSVAADACNQV